MAVLLSAVVAATGVLAGEATDTDSATEVADALNLQLDELGVVGIVVALAIWSVAYYSGGYVAGRMARFDGVKQGVAVWAWALVVAILIGVLAAVAGDDYTVTAGLPDLDLERTTTVIVGAGIVALAAWSAPCSAGSPACASTAAWTARARPLTSGGRGGLALD